MRKIALGVLLAVAALILALMVAVGLAPQSQAVDIDTTTAKRSTSCTLFWTTDYRDYTRWIMLNKHEWRLKHEMHVRHCWRSGRPHGKHWVDPIKSSYGCRQIEADDSALRNVKFNNRIWDFDGHGINPSAVYVECNKETWTEVERWYLQETRLHKCAAGPPRWHADVKMNLYLETDGHIDLASAFWGYYLPTLVTC